MARRFYFQVADGGLNIDLTSDKNSYFFTISWPTRGNAASIISDEILDPLRKFCGSGENCGTNINITSGQMGAYSNYLFAEEELNIKEKRLFLMMMIVKFIIKNKNLQTDFKFNAFNRQIEEWYYSLEHPSQEIQQAYQTHQQRLAKFKEPFSQKINRYIALAEKYAAYPELQPIIAEFRSKLEALLQHNICVTAEVIPELFSIFIQTCNAAQKRHHSSFWQRKSGFASELSQELKKLLLANEAFSGSGLKIKSSSPSDFLYEIAWFYFDRHHHKRFISYGHVNKHIKLIINCLEVAIKTDEKRFVDWFLKFHKTNRETMERIILRSGVILRKVLTTPEIYLKLDYKLLSDECYILSTKSQFILLSNAWFTDKMPKKKFYRYLLRFVNDDTVQKIENSTTVSCELKIFLRTIAQHYNLINKNIEDSTDKFELSANIKKTLDKVKQKADAGNIEFQILMVEFYLNIKDNAKLLDCLKLLVSNPDLDKVDGSVLLKLFTMRSDKTDGSENEQTSSSLGTIYDEINEIKEKIYEKFFSNFHELSEENIYVLAENGSAMANYYLAKIYLGQLKLEEAFSHFAAVSSNSQFYADAQFELGNIELCVNHDKDKAFTHFSKSNAKAADKFKLPALVEACALGDNATLANVYSPLVKMEENGSVTLFGTLFPNKDAVPNCSPDHCASRKEVSKKRLKELWKQYLKIKQQKYFKRKTSAETQEVYNVAEISEDDHIRYVVLQKYVLDPKNQHREFCGLLKQSFPQGFFEEESFKAEEKNQRQNKK